jgi:TonB family protein
LARSNRITVDFVCRPRSHAAGKQAACALFPAPARIFNPSAHFMDLSTERTSSIVRWTLCGIGSVALHFALLSGNGSPGAARTTIATGTGTIEVRLGMAQKAGIQATESVSQWRPLRRWSAEKSRFTTYPSLLPFSSVNLKSHVVDETAYLPVSRLTMRPTPVKAIFVPYPDVARRSGRLTARLVLLIDEDGTVARITINDPQLHPVLAEAALSAFEHARFHPGKIDGTSVKTRMVVDVEFEDRAPTS